MRISRAIRRRVTLEQAKADLRGKPFGRKERRRMVHRLWRNLMTTWPLGVDPMRVTRILRREKLGKKEQRHG